MATTSMDDILSDKKPEAPAETVDATEAPPPSERGEAPPERSAEPEAERAEKARSKRREHQKKEWEAQGRDPETGQFVSKAPETKDPEKPADAKKTAEPQPAKPSEAAKPAETAEAMTPKEKAAFAAAADERRKRQALEQQLAAMTAGKPPAQPEKPKAFWDDPEGALRNHQEAIRRESIQTRLQTAEMIARSRHPDFDEKIAKFAELVQRTPGLAQQWLASADPGEFAYTTANNHMLLEQAGSLDKLRSDIEAKARAEERAKVEAEFKAKEDERERQRAALPGTLTDVRGAASRRNAPVYTGPTSMDDILKH